MTIKKFRIRLENKNTKEIATDFVTLDELLNRNGCYWSKKWRVLTKNQYIGLKDKNGVEIYEWDIIEFESEVLKIKKLFYIESYEAQFIPIPFTKSIIEAVNNGRVIGTVYENPELFKEVGNE